MSEADSKSAKPAAEASQVKETIESILVAFILAFIFRAFVVEAFVIPTGSMAPTLLGAHLHFVCPDCGYAFDVNYATDDREGDDVRIPGDGFPPTDVYCPNCGYQVAKASDIQPVHFGDRILVLKYVYLLHNPRRWDVVVFKSPYEPDTSHYTTNYIKRLVGLPGEKIMVLAGNLYTATAAEPQWQIQRKPRSAQEAMWRIVYDNDFHPQKLTRSGQNTGEWEQPWKTETGSGWNTDGRTFQFDNSASSGTLRFNPDVNPTTQTLSDYLVYDADPTRYPTRTPADAGTLVGHPVSDLKLAVNYQRLSGDGPLQLTLTRHDQPEHAELAFTAEILPDRVRLLEESQGQSSEVASAKMADLGILPGQKIYAEFSNVDYEVTLRLNGRNAFNPVAYQPNVPWLMSQWRSRAKSEPGEARIFADHQTCALNHVGLWRDVYYCDDVSDQPIDPNPEVHGSPHVLANAMPNNPIQLGANEYFVMGDNSIVSADGRYWEQPINLPQEGLVNVAAGRVPGQFMLGQAVFVYWPAGFAPSWLHIPVVPNFGEMRWIH